MLSYCGIHLTMLSEGQKAEIASWLDPQWMLLFATKNWPGLDLTNMGFRGSLPVQPVKMNSLYWPRDASRFAVGYFAADEKQLADIRTYLENNEDEGPFVIADGVNSITTTLSMLPARPLQRVTGLPGLYLLTLVDERFFWWTRGGDYTFQPGVTTWLQLYASLATALGLTLTTSPPFGLGTMTADAPSANYLFPGEDFADALAYQLAYLPGGTPAIANTGLLSLPVLLDAAAFSCGQRIVRQLDGTVQAINAATGRSIFAADLMLGDMTGRIMGDAFDDADSWLALPSSIAMTFPVLETHDRNGQYFVATSNVLDAQGNDAGNGEQMTLHCTKGAIYLPGAGAPVNVTTLQKIADQAAADWYAWNSLGLDVVWQGAINWKMSGIESLVEYQATDDRVCARVQSGPWLDHIDRLLIWGCPPPEDCCEQWVRILCTASGTYGWPGLVQLYNSGSESFGDLDGRTATIGS